MKVIIVTMMIIIIVIIIIMFIQIERAAPALGRPFQGEALV